MLHILLQNLINTLARWQIRQNAGWAGISVWSLYVLPISRWALAVSWECESKWCVWVLSPCMCWRKASHDITKLKTAFFCKVGYWVVLKYQCFQLSLCLIKMLNQFATSWVGVWRPPSSLPRGLRLRGSSPPGFWHLLWPALPFCANCLSLIAGWRGRARVFSSGSGFMNPECGWAKRCVVFK